jgi:LacI family transcriptional regulator
MTTIYDIARYTGFSPPTVSKALNDQSDVSASTKRKILEVARELGYIPNPNAKVLVTKKSWLIGLLFEEDDLGVGMEHPLFGGIMNAFKTRMEEEGYELLFIARNLGRKKMSLLDHCRYRSVDAVLIVNCIADSEEVLEVVRSGFKCVSSNVVFPGVCTVTSENVRPSAEAVRYLYDLGHRDIAHIAGPQDENASAGRERLEGYTAGLASCGLPFRDDLVSIGVLWNMRSGYEAMMDLWTREKRPTALFSAGDILTIGIMNACRELGVRIPEDLSIVSFDDNEWAGHASPGLTTFRQDRSAIGNAAADLMLKLLSDMSVPDRTLIPVTFVERSSCRRLGG